MWELSGTQLVKMSVLYQRQDEICFLPRKIFVRSQTHSHIVDFDLVGPIKQSSLQGNRHHLIFVVHRNHSVFWMSYENHP